MIRSIAALLLAGLACSVSVDAAPDPPLCRVTAEYRPVSWPEWTDPAERFRRVTVRLRPGCPAGGEARVYLVNQRSGRRLPESGEYRLSLARPVLHIPGAPAYAVTTPGWIVYWRSASGRSYPVPQTQLSPLGGAR